jgi:cardiolipin synthase
LTLLRLLSLPVFVQLVAHDSWLPAAALLFAMAVSDVLDGQLARRLNQVSRLGTALDPVADRLTVITVTVTLLLAGVAPAVLVILIVTRDLLITALVVVVFRRRLPIPVTGTAKLATAGLLFGIPVLVLSHASVPGAGAIRTFAIIVIASGTALYYLAFMQYLAAGLRSRRGDR